MKYSIAWPYPGVQSPPTMEPTDDEQIVACLQDDAAKLMQSNPADEMAAMMLVAALRISVLSNVLNHASDWLHGAPHGDNCFVSDHYDGDPGNQCNCGRDWVLERIAAAQSGSEPPNTVELAK